tara:strand:+ start:4637 stop:4795 length:159 start_codon:yes stop_codon:yes gene_type:complete
MKKTKYTPNKILSIEELRKKVEAKIYGEERKDLEKLGDTVKNKLKDLGGFFN